MLWTSITPGSRFCSSPNDCNSGGPGSDRSKVEMVSSGAVPLITAATCSSDSPIPSLGQVPGVSATGHQHSCSFQLCTQSSPPQHLIHRPWSTTWHASQMVLVPQVQLSPLCGRLYSNSVLVQKRVKVGDSPHHSKCLQLCYVVVAF